MYTQNHQLFHTSTLPSDIRFTQNLGLLNSLYMRAHWFYSYEPEKTQTRQFTTETGLIKAHSFMRIDPTINYPNNPRDGGKDVSYSQVLGAEAISQDLAWGYEMMIIRPTEKSALSWAQIATVGEWYTLKSGMEVYGIQELVMPRWRQEQNHNLLSLLQKLNLPTFNQNPDLSKLLEKPLKLEFIQHHTALDIDEKGLNGGTKDPRGSNLEEPKKQLSFAVDKPFFYTIHNKYTNAILYMGIVNDPTQP
jgi:serine protease inhibitor